MNALKLAQQVNRRLFLRSSGMSLGAMAWARCLTATVRRRHRCRPAGRQSPAIEGPAAGLPGLPHFPPRTKRVIYLFQSGAPSQLDLFDHKPALRDKHGHRAARLGPDGPADHHDDLGAEELPGGPVDLQVRPARAERRMAQRAACRTRPTIADDICLIRSMQTEAINHDPAITFVQTGSQLAGRPSMGAWVAYGLGSENAGPAGLRGLAVARADRPAALRPPLGQRLPADALPGREAARGQGAGALPRQPRRLLAGRRAGRCSTTSARSTTCTTPRPAIPRSSRGSPSTSWPIACRPRSPS